MTTEDQDAEVGRLVRERHDLRAGRSALLSKASQIGKLLNAVGKALTTQPTNGPLPLHGTAVQNDGIVQAPDEYRTGQTHRGLLPTGADLRRLLDEVTAVEQRLAELDEHLKAFGI